MYIYKSLKDVPYREITECFNIAFSDYAFSMQFTEDQLQNHLEMSGIHWEKFGI